ncbi:MAG TPA: hypothetical protein VL201_03630 [Patescibacteria group bacterium]|nr:hypothetical protein [Patescibacteria group bacterium]
MIHFFVKRSVFLMTVFFVFCQNNGMNSLIPYNFCGKSIRKNPLFDKVPLNRQDNIFSRDTYFEIGRNILETDSCNEILWSWMGTYSHNQYLNFLCLISKFAEKIRCDAAIVLIGINAIGKDNFFKCIEDITVKEIATKVNNNCVITVIEYALLKSIPVKRNSIPIHKEKVWVKKTLVERYCPTKERLIRNMGIVSSLNISCVAGCIGSGYADSEKCKNSFGEVELVGLFILTITDGLNNNSPILKPYEPTIID